MKFYNEHRNNHKNKIILIFILSITYSLYAQTTHYQGVIIPNAYSSISLDSAAGVNVRQHKPYKPLKLPNGVLNESYLIYNDTQKKERFVAEWITLLRIVTYSEQYEPQLWTIHPDTTTILSYKCHKATCRFRGRNWIAWFCSDIPINAGPWKLNGLPRLILKAYDEDKYFCFSCIGLENLIKNKESIDIAKELNDRTKSSRESFIKAQNNFYNDHLNTLLSLGFHVNIYDEEGNTIQTMELTNKSWNDRNLMFNKSVYYKDKYKKIPYTPIELK